MLALLESPRDEAACVFDFIPAAGVSRVVNKLIVDFPAAPRQSDSTSCGVIACMFAYTYLKTGKRIATAVEDWNQDIISKLRLFMAFLIHKNKNLKTTSGIQPPPSFKRTTEIYDLTYV
jgi:hypothetical protein